MRNKKKQLKIKILTTEGFPVGLAASNRIMTYAKGFAEQNCRVSVHCIKPTEVPGKVFNHKKSGNINGVEYYYDGGKTILASSFIYRRIDNIKATFKMCFNLIREKKADKTDAIIYYSSSSSRALVLYFITKIKKIILLKEESEFPAVYLAGMNPVQKLFYNKIHYTLFDGYLLMTKRLIQYFVKDRKIKTPYLHVPMTVDYKRFHQTSHENSTCSYIAYCGVLNNAKDGVDILIDAFALIAEKFPDTNLYLIGDAATKNELNLYLEKIKKYHLSKRIILTGRVSKDEIPQLLCNSKILVLPRPLSLQAEGGFPTKLGEYLATGKPVIATVVGEIPLYLENKLNVFFAKPGSAVSISVQIKTILEDYQKAIIIGKNGREVVMKKFNYLIQSKDIIDFIHVLKNIEHKRPT